jgi:hypothetical protein
VKKKLASTWKKKKKKKKILAGPNEWQQVCNRSNPEKTGRSCEGAGFSWLSSKDCCTCCGNVYIKVDEAGAVVVVRPTHLSDEREAEIFLHGSYKCGGARVTFLAIGPKGGLYTSRH